VSLTVDISDSFLLDLINYILHADPNKIAQVIRNLISNALKFTPADGHVTISFEAITLRELSSSKASNLSQRNELTVDEDVVSALQVKVTDSGAGISEASLLVSANVSVYLTACIDVNVRA
jgi:signal transduction histidine kinase